MPPENDIFGQPQTEPDISSEALNWEPDDTFDMEPAVDAEAPLPTGEEDDNTNTDDATEVVEGAEGDEENSDEAAAVTPENTDELPEQFRGKSPAELAKMVLDSQNFITKQGNEIGDLRKAVEQVAATQAQVNAPEMLPASEYIHDEQDGLLAYREAIGLLDRGEVGPKAIDDIIDVVREINPVTAAKMDRDFGMRLARAEMQQQMAPVIQQSYNDALAQGAARVNADPDAEAYREDIVRIVQNPQSLIEHQVQVAYQQARTAPDIAAALGAALQLARGADPIKSASYKTTLATRKQDEAVEHGNASTVDKPLTEEERVIQSLLQPKDPGVDLFAGFGGN